MTVVLGPLPCLTCKRAVVWDRVGSQLRLLERAGRTFRRHQHPEICGAWMSLARERCGRLAGHSREHRTEYALGNQRVAKRSGWAAA